MKMRILHVMSGDVLGGAEMAFTDLICALQEEGLEQRAIIRTHPERAEKLLSMGVPVLQLPFRRRLDFKTPIAIAKFANEFEPKIVQCWMERAASMTPKGDYMKVGWLGGYYKPKYFKDCDHLVGVTKDVSEHLFRKGLPTVPTVTIPTFCEIDANAKALDRAQFNTPEKVPLILALGRLHSDKALDTLLRALALVPGPYLWIAGEGPLRQQLMQLTQNLGLAERVRFLGWRNDRDALLKTCDICAFPSRVEGFGTVMIEAWANHVPLVTASSPGPKAHVRHRENGLIVAIDDVEALAAALHEAMNNKTLVEHMTKTAFHDYQSQFTKNAVAKAYVKFYSGLISHVDGSS